MGAVPQKQWSHGGRNNSHPNPRQKPHDLVSAATHDVGPICECTTTLTLLFHPVCMWAVMALAAAAAALWRWRGEKCNFKEVEEERFQLFHFPLDAGVLLTNQHRHIQHICSCRPTDRPTSSPSSLPSSFFTVSTSSSGVGHCVSWIVRHSCDSALGQVQESARTMPVSRCGT